MIKRIVSLTILIISLLSFSALALAQTSTTSGSSNGEGFTITSANPNTINPRKFIFEIKPGDTLRDFVEISNLADHEETYLLYGADPTFSAQGTPAYKTRQVGGSAEGQWVHFNSAEVTLKANEKRIVEFSITVPPNAALGDYRAGIAMEKINKEQEQPGITIATRIILHSEIKVTNNPSPTPKQDGTFTGTHSAPTTIAATTDWRSIYFWISLLLFITSFIALLWITLQERKEKNIMKTIPIKPIVKSKPKTKKKTVVKPKTKKKTVVKPKSKSKTKK